jgi:hypothetical protein
VVRGTAAAQGGRRRMPGRCATCGVSRERRCRQSPAITRSRDQGGSASLQVVEKPDGIVREVIFPFERGGIVLCVRSHRTTHHHGVTSKRRRGCKLATKQRGNFIVPNLVLRQGIGPKAGFLPQPYGTIQGASKLVRQSYRQIDNRCWISGLKRMVSTF